MLKQPPLKDLKDGDELAHLVRILRVGLQEKNNKRPWLNITFADSSRKISAKKWGSSKEEADKYKSAKYLFVTGKVQDYNGGLSAIVETLAFPGDDITEEEYKSLNSEESFKHSKDSEGPASEDSFSPVSKEELDFATRKQGQKLLKEMTIKDEPVDLVLRLNSVESREASNGKPFLEFKMGDSSSNISAKRWDAKPEMAKLFEGVKVAHVIGAIDFYQGKKQVKAQEVHPITDITEEDVRDLYVSSPYNLTMLKKGIWRHIQNIKNPFIKKLAELVLQQPLVKERFGTWAAAVSMHHNYRGGLATHVFRLMELADIQVDGLNTRIRYPNQKVTINKDIVMFLCLMHDMFKIESYTESGEMADEGRLVPHLPKGAIFCERLMDQIPDFPEELRTQISHGLLSHHGTLPFGSPVEPLTLEAMVFHYLDMLTSKLDPMIEALSDLPEGAKWTERLNPIKSPAYIGGTLFVEQKEEEE